ncbi:MAG: hypothetical protein JNK05_17160 [Myxococcales bacterium]|nr:hypothetical protein [Myxococcales bacterium]
MEAAKKSAGEHAASWVQYLGMTVAMLGGATWPAPKWSIVAVGILILCAGILWARRARASTTAQSAEGAREKPLDYARQRVTEALERTRALRATAESAELTAIAAGAEAIVRECVEAVAKAQEAIAAAHGFNAYAEIMTPFAAGERWLNRAWSAASDGHRGEATHSLDRAIEHIERATRAG